MIFQALLMRIWIRIRLATLMRIQIFKIVRIKICNIAFSEHFYLDTLTFILHLYGTVID